MVLYDRATEVATRSGPRWRRSGGWSWCRPSTTLQVIAGQGTVGLEIAAQAAEAGVTAADVLVCTGGGGLAAGIALALEAEAPGLRVRPAEPEGFDDMARSLAAGERVGNAGNRVGLRRDPDAAAGDADLPDSAAAGGAGPRGERRGGARRGGAGLPASRAALEPGGAVALAAALFRGGDIAGDAVVCVATGETSRRRRSRGRSARGDAAPWKAARRPPYDAQQPRSPGECRRETRFSTISPS